MRSIGRGAKRYLKGTINFGIRHIKGKTGLEEFVDVDWAGCPVDRSYNTLDSSMNRLHDEC